MPIGPLLLFFLLASSSLWGLTNSSLIHSMKTRLHDLPMTNGKLIQSYTQGTQSYIYDQALAIIAFTHFGEHRIARSLLKGLNHLQREDGSLYFSYYLDGKSPYPEEGDRRYAGAIAWVGLAASHYQHQTGSTEFKKFNRSLLRFLGTQMSSTVIDGKSLQAVRFAPTDLSFTNWNEKEIAALEHNVDAYSAFKHYGELNHEEDFKEMAANLRPFIFTMWDKTHGHFWSGADLSKGKINKDEFYLDNQSWTLLALDKEEMKGICPSVALDSNCQKLFVETTGIKGFMDRRPMRGPASHNFVWSEGTSGQIMAMEKIGLKCKDMDSSDFLESVKRMKKEDGNIAYATPTADPDFTTKGSIAGSAWLYFAMNKLNPFQLPILKLAQRP